MGTLTKTSNRETGDQDPSVIEMGTLTGTLTRETTDQDPSTIDMGTMTGHSDARNRGPRCGHVNQDGNKCSYRRIRRRCRPRCDRPRRTDSEQKPFCGYRNAYEGEERDQDSPTISMGTMTGTRCVKNPTRTCQTRTIRALPIPRVDELTNSTNSDDVR